MQLKKLMKNTLEIEAFEISEQDNLFIVKRNKIVEFKSKDKSRCQYYVCLQEKQLERCGTTRFPLLEL